MPAHGTKMTPASAARSGTRGRLPLGTGGTGGTGGNSGSSAAQSVNRRGVPMPIGAASS